MNMFQDKAGMMPLMKAGLMKMGMGMDDSGPIAPEVVERVIRLIEDEPELSRDDQFAANGINGRPFGLKEQGFAARRGETLRWRVSEGGDQMLHPVHIHGCQFRILSQNGQPPETHRAGWKDIAPLSNGGASEILLRFPYEADASAPYMAHCHILEHEDSGMMTQFTVA
jgi:blue copper oxidase